MRARRPAGSDGATQDHNSHETRGRSKPESRRKDTDGAPEGKRPQPGRKAYCECPLCGKRLEVERKDFEDELRPYWLECFSCKAGGLDGGAYLRALAAEVDVRPEQLLLDPLKELHPWVRWNGQRSTSPPEPLPSGDQFRRWRNALRRSGQPLAYLTDVRGITRPVLELNAVGWDGARLVFPMLHAGELVAWKTREPRPGANMKMPRGSNRPWPLYPEPQPDDEWILLVEGELDALAGRSAGLPACSITKGVHGWRDEWIEDLRGRPVVVCFDNGAETWTSRRSDELRAAGIRARALSLRRLGLDSPKGDLNDWLQQGGTAEELRRYVNRRRTK